MPVFYVPCADIQPDLQLAMSVIQQILIESFKAHYIRTGSLKLIPPYFACKIYILST
jgi:hypothetical protein